MEYSITDHEGATIQVEAENWLLALGMVLPAFDVDVNALGRVTCVPGADGSVFVDDVRAGRSWMVREIEVIPAPPPAALPPPPPRPPPPPAPEIKVMISARSAAVEAEVEADDLGFRGEPEPTDMSRPPPSLSMPVRASFHREPVESLAERLFDLSMDLSMMEPDEACQAALDLVVEFVPCEAASVARGTLNDEALTFVASTGPVARKVVGRTLHFGEGLVGMCFDMCEPLLVRDVSESIAFTPDFDQATGFRTRSVLCVPVLDDDGIAYGVIELLNPVDRPFLDEDQEAVQTVARTLAGVLSSL